MLQDVYKRQVLLHPSDVLVYVRVTEPGDSALTTPALFTVAILVFPEDQVPFEAGLTFAVNPTQAEEGPLNTGAPGTAFMVTILPEPEVQPV